MVPYLDKSIRPLVLILPKMSGYLRTFDVKDKTNKQMSFRTDADKSLKI